ncbi:hypothetical protein YC2023_039455 [Brassica napus]
MGSLLKYNALEDFQKVFQTTSRKSSRRLQRSLPDDLQEPEVFKTLYGIEEKKFNKEACR